MNAGTVAFEPCAKRIRAVVNAKTIADSLCATLVLERHKMSAVYYFPRDDVRMDLLQPTNHRAVDELIGEAGYWNVQSGTRRVDNAAWSYAQPRPDVDRLRDLVAFDWDKVDHWYEEDEEVFGHPRDPRHLVEVRPSSRKVRVVFAGKPVAETQRALVLFETDLPARYYIPRADVHEAFIRSSQTTSLCPYKGRASYWTLEVDGRTATDAAWSYMDPLPECPRIRGHICFYPEKVDALEVEGEETGA